MDNPETTPDRECTPEAAHGSEVVAFGDVLAGLEGREGCRTTERKAESEEVMRSAILHCRWTISGAAIRGRSRTRRER